MLKCFLLCLVKTDTGSEASLVSTFPSSLLPGSLLIRDRSFSPLFFSFSSIINGCLFLFERAMQIRFENGAWSLVRDKMFPLNERLKNRYLRSTYGVMDVLFWLLPVAKTPGIHIKKRTSLFWIHSGGFSLWLGGLVAFSVVGRSHGGEHVIGTCGQGAEWGKQGPIKLNKMLWSKNIFEYLYLC